jgi:DNA processing protein
MLVNKLTVIPEQLQNIPQPPQSVFHSGASLEALLQQPCVAIVGSRRVTPYGRHVTADLARKLAEQGCIIVSGLAYGVDTVAHEAALAAGGKAIAVLPTPLTSIAPAANRKLAARIIEQGGALISEYADGTNSHKLHFVERNRLMAGLSKAVVITEAAKKSGSLHTAHFALDQGKEVLAVPGNITSEQSGGTNLLIKSGATPVIDYTDILCAVGIEHSRTKKHSSSDPHEQLLLDLFETSPLQSSEQLLVRSQLDIQTFTSTMTRLEITGSVKMIGNGSWTLS